MNTVMHGDNIEVMRGMDDECIDLIATDPPYNTRRIQNGSNFSWSESHNMEYNDSFVNLDDYTHDKSRWQCKKQEWHEKYKHHEFYFLHHICSTTELYYYFHFIPLVYEFKRVLKYGGALYWHIDYRTTHIWRVIMAKVFGDKESFNSEIIWHNPLSQICPTISHRYGVNHSTILMFSKYSRYNNGGIHTLNCEYENNTHTKQRTVWMISGCKKNERVGYPTQKPIALYAKIIRASSNEGDVVLDPFCGSGTTLVAAHKLGRKYIGIDQSEEAVNLTNSRLEAERLTLFEGVS